MANSLNDPSKTQLPKGNATGTRDLTNGNVPPSRSSMLKDPGDKRREVKQGKPEVEDTTDKSHGLTAAVVQTTIPVWLNIGIMVSLIFGGCCSNVVGRLLIFPENFLFLLASQY